MVTVQWSEPVASTKPSLKDLLEIRFEELMRMRDEGNTKPRC